MDQDCRGYYATLGVPPKATAAEIKSAYRRLAKTHHPDGGVAQTDAEIKRINEAYAVLGDPENRATYDADNLRTPREAVPRERLQPIRCGQCNKVSAQPKYLIFWRVYSLVLATGRVPIQGVYCASCAKTEALKSTAYTALLGWWGVPWGPIWTIVNGFKNAVGGEQQRERDEILAWHNVMAFLQAGQIPIAYGLAEKLQRSQDRQIAAAASNFTSLCRSNGFAPKGELKDTWQTVRNQTPVRVAMLLLVPATIAIWVIGANAQQSQPFAAASQPDAFTYSDASANSYTLDPAIPEAPIALEPACENPPRNGEILAGGENLEAEGHRLEIDNGSSGDAIIKVRNATTNQLYASFFVKNGQSTSLSGVSDGDYKFQYALGDALGKDCKSFVGDYAVSEFPGDKPLYKKYVSDYRGEGYEYSVLSYTLYSVPGGNVRPHSISNDQFNAD